MNDSRRVPKGNVREVFSVALPMVVSLSCDTVMIFTDRWFVSRLDSSAMNAVFAGGLAAFVAQTFFTGLIGYSTAMVGQRLGARRTEDCVLSTYQALITALIAWPLLLLLIPFGNYVFPRLGLPHAQLGDQIRYFDLLMLGSGLGLLRGAFSSFFSGIGRTRIVMLSSLFSMAANVLLVWILVFGHFGLPALGVTGAAIGTLIAGALGVLVLGAFFVSSRGARALGALPRFRIVRPLLVELLRKGIPSGGEFFLNTLAFQVIVFLFQRQGETSATAATIMFNWDMVSFVPLVGVEIGVTSLVGRYIGARNHAAVRRTLRSGLLLGWAFSAIVLVAFVAFPAALVDLFRSDPPTAAFLSSRTLAIRMIQIASIYVTIEAVLLVLTGALRGAGDTLFAMFVSTGMHWVLVIALWVVIELFGASTLTGWSVLVGIFVFFPLAYALRWKTGRWRRAIVVEPSSFEPAAP
jgi:MATE family multidrug resistance protein